MAELGTDRVDFDAGAQQVSSRRVSYRMSAYALGRQCWHYLARQVGVAGDCSMDSEARDRLTDPIHEARAVQVSGSPQGRPKTLSLPTTRGGCGTCSPTMAGASLPARERKQEPQRVAITGLRVTRAIPFSRQMFEKELETARRFSSFMAAPSIRLDEALACYLDEVRRHLQVALCRPNIDVAKVGSKLRTQELDVLTCPMLCHHAMHGRGVAKVMRARGPAFASRASDTCSSADVLKPRNDARVVPRSSTARGSNT